MVNGRLKEFEGREREKFIKENKGMHRRKMVKSLGEMEKKRHKVQEEEEEQGWRYSREVRRNGRAEESDKKK